MEKKLNALGALAIAGVWATIIVNPPMGGMVASVLSGSGAGVVLDGYKEHKSKKVVAIVLGVIAAVNTVIYVTNPVAITPVILANVAGMSAGVLIKRETANVVEKKLEGEKVKLIGREKDRDEKEIVKTRVKDTDGRNRGGLEARLAGVILELKEIRKDIDKLPTEEKQALNDKFGLIVDDTKSKTQQAEQRVLDGMSADITMSEEDVSANSKTPTKAKMQHKDVINHECL